VHVTLNEENIAALQNSLQLASAEDPHYLSYEDFVLLLFFTTMSMSIEDQPYSNPVIHSYRVRKLLFRSILEQLGYDLKDNKAFIENLAWHMEDIKEQYLESRYTASGIHPSSSHIFFTSDDESESPFISTSATIATAMDIGVEENTRDQLGKGNTDSKKMEEDQSSGSTQHKTIIPSLLVSLNGDPDTVMKEVEGENQSSESNQSNLPSLLVSCNGDTDIMMEVESDEKKKHQPIPSSLESTGIEAVCEIPHANTQNEPSHQEDTGVKREPEDEPLQSNKKIKE